MDVVSSGATANPVPGETHGGEAAGPRVFLLRGLFDVFSLGLDDLAAEMRAVGIDATSLSGPTWPTLADEFERDFEAGSFERPVVLVGHSFGADDAVHLCRYLKAKGVPIRLLVLLDATTPPGIPLNVGRCVHYYIPTPLSDLLPEAFAGNPVEPATDNQHTEILNIIFDQQNFGDAIQGSDHFTIESNARIHELVIEHK